MVKWHSLTVILLVVFLSACSRFNDKQPQLDSQDTNVAGTWKVVASPSGTGLNSLQSVATVSANNVWAVGYSGNPIFGGNALIENFNGSSWSIVASPQIQNSRLDGVAAVSASDVWAVGSFIPDASSLDLTLIEHWNGSSWSVVPSPTPGVYSRLRAVTALASNNVWAVGSYSSSGDKSLILHWDGSSWKVVPSPNVGSFVELRGISAVSANDIWAVGDSLTNTGWKTLTMHWNGSQWQIVPSPNSNLGASQLFGVLALNANNVWAVGFGGPKTLTMRWNGSRWWVVNSPNFTDNVNFWFSGLTSVSAGAANDIWAVGNASRTVFCPTDYCPTYFRTLILHYNGSSWSVVPSPSPTQTSDRLFGVATVSSTEAWAVGFSGANTLTERYTIP